MGGWVVFLRAHGERLLFNLRRHCFSCTLLLSSFFCIFSFHFSLGVILFGAWGVICFSLLHIACISFRSCKTGSSYKSGGGFGVFAIGSHFCFVDTIHWCSHFCIS
jgi:hypothetical protein